MRRLQTYDEVRFWSVLEVEPGWLVDITQRQAWRHTSRLENIPEQLLDVARKDLKEKSRMTQKNVSDVHKGISRIRNSYSTEWIGGYFRVMVMVMVIIIIAGSGKVPTIPNRSLADPFVCKR